MRIIITTSAAANKKVPGYGLIQPGTSCFLSVKFRRRIAQGTASEGVNPNAVIVMDEVGIDIPNNESKVFDQALLDSADLVVALRDVQEGCFILPPTVRYVHCPVEDPAAYAAGGENQMSVFRNVRDKIKKLVKELLS